MARRLWIQSDSTRGGAYSLAVDIDEIAAVNVPDIDKPGCNVTLKSGHMISFPNWDGTYRDECIKFLIDFMQDRLTPNQEKEKQE